MADVKARWSRRPLLVLLTGVLILASCGSGDPEQASAVDTEVSRAIGGPDGSQPGLAQDATAPSIEVDGIVATQETGDAGSVESDEVIPEVDGNEVVPEAESAESPSEDNVSNLVDDLDNLEEDLAEDPDALEDAILEDIGVDPELPTPVLEEAVQATGVEKPCDLFTAAELSDLIRESAGARGLFDQLPAGLPDAEDLSFEIASETDSTCDWFSEQFLWFVSLSWEAADPVVVDSVFGDRETYGTSEYSAVQIDDTFAHLVAADFLVQVANIVPGHAGLSDDRLVSQDVVAFVAESLG